MLHMTLILLFFLLLQFKSFFLKKHFWAKFDNKHVFTIGVLLINAFNGSCHCFEENIILPTQFCRTKKNIRLMPISSDLSHLRPKWING